MHGDVHFSHMASLRRYPDGRKLFAARVAGVTGAVDSTIHVGGATRAASATRSTAAIGIATGATGRAARATCDRSRCSTICRATGSSAAAAIVGRTATCRMPTRATSGAARCSGISSIARGTTTDAETRCIASLPTYAGLRGDAQHRY
jgi:hypothetical protein